MKTLKHCVVSSALALAALFSTTASATTVLEYYTWYGNPYAYNGVWGCTWTYTGSYGGSWGSQFLYVSVGSCTFSTMQVNHPASSQYATVVLD